MRKEVQISDLIRKNDRDITVFQAHLANLTGKPGTAAYMGDLRRRIVLAETSNAILRAAR